MLQYEHMRDGIRVRILGDSGPFSKMGKSSGYLVTVGKSNYLIDCGAQLFQQIGGYGLKSVKGLIVTHCHDDHKRWFTDVAIFYRYARDIDFQVPLMTSEVVHSELCRMAEPALDRTLSDDQKTVIDLPCNMYINYTMLGPAARYRIISKEEGAGRFKLCIVDELGNEVGPDRAKIVIHRDSKRPRMLFKDPESNEWIEPESYYSFSSDIFYSKDKNIHRDQEGFFIEAVKAPVWHGIPNIGIKISTGKETLIFSSDTVHDVLLWRDLYSEKRSQRLGMTQEEFDAASIIYGDINDYIERIWSEQRFREAAGSFTDAVVIHDVSVRDSIVHTSYDRLCNTMLRKDRTILTHSPDTITSSWVMCSPEKHLIIRGNEFFELVSGEVFPINADIYHKENGKYYVGYRNEKGRYLVYQQDGMLYLSSRDVPHYGKVKYRIDLYEDIRGSYLPKIEKENSYYHVRKDGRIELVEMTEDGSVGRIVESHRKGLLKAKKETVRVKT